MLQSTWESIVPSNLGQATQVMSLDGSTLVVMTEQGGMAAKLRQMTPSLLRLLATKGVILEAIAIKVLPPLPREPVVPSRDGQPLSEDTLDQFEQLYRQTEPSRLKDALRNLLESRGRKTS